MNRHAAGFTLLEILVAFVVLMLIGGTLLQLFQGGLRNIDSSRQLTYAALLARSKLNELQVTANLTEGSSEGRFDQTYRWTLLLEPYTQEQGQPLPDSPLRGLQATLTVHWEPRGSYRLDTLLLAGRTSP